MKEDGTGERSKEKGVQGSKSKVARGWEHIGIRSSLQVLQGI
jgi:hypothetical protein